MLVLPAPVCIAADTSPLDGFSGGGVETGGYYCSPRQRGGVLKGLPFHTSAHTFSNWGLSVMCWLLCLATLPFLLGWQDKGLSQTVSEQPDRLGRLQISVTKFEQFILVGDSFTGPTHYDRIGHVYLRIRNVGDFPICAELVPTVEEYKNSELWNIKPVKTGFRDDPKVRQLEPGGESTGSYSFQLSPAQRTYVLVLEQREKSQGCGEQRRDRKTFVTGTRALRLALGATQQN